MPYNGSGSFSPPGTDYPAVSGALATAAHRNAVDADFATGLSTAICKDGQTTITANLPMSGFKFTGLGDGSARSDSATLANIQDGTGVYVATVGGTADVITLTPAPAITAYTAGQTFRFVASGANTTNVTVNINSLGARAITKNGTTALTTGDIPSGSIVQITYDGTRFLLTGVNLVARMDAAHNADGTIKSTQIVVGGGGQGAYATYSSGVFTLYGAPRGHLHGLTLSTGGSSATMSIAAGICTDSTYALPMYLTGTLAKTTSAWAVGTGNGGLDTGAIANSTWYHWYLIYRSDTGVVDALCSLSATAPTMPANYSYKRRIGAGLTNGSGQWVSFTQDGDYFRWAATVLDINATNPGTSAVLRTLSVPTGVNVFARFNVYVTANSGTELWIFSDPSGNDEAPSSTAAPLSQAFAVASSFDGSFGPLEIRTNTSAQVRSRLNSSPSGAGTILRMATMGWIDRRGRDN